MLVSHTFRCKSSLGRLEENKGGEIKIAKEEDTEKNSGEVEGYTMIDEGEMA